MTFLTTFILIIKLYNSIIELLGENIKKNLDCSHFLCHFLQNLSDFSLFQKNCEGIFKFYRERAFIQYKNKSSPIIFSPHHERIKFL